MAGVEFTVSLKDLVTGAAEKMKGAMEGLSGGVESAFVSFGRLISPVQQGRNEMGQFTAASGALDESMAAIGGPIGIAVAALATLATGLASVTVAMGEMVVEASDARAKLDAQFSSLMGNAKAGQETIEMMDRLGASTGMTREQMAPLAEQFAALGFKGKALEDQLTAVAAAQSLGMGGEQKYLDVIQKVNQHIPVQSRSLAELYKTGVNVADIANAMGVSVKTLEGQLKKGTVNVDKFNQALANTAKSKDADSLAAQADNLGNQWALFKENVSELFEGLAHDPGLQAFLGGIKDIFGVFSQTNASGQVMKAGITAAFHAIFTAAAKVLPYIKKGLEYIILYALKVAVFFKQHWSTIAPILKVVGVGLLVIVGVITALVAVAVGLGAAMAALAGIMVGVVVAAVGAVVKAFLWLSDEAAAIGAKIRAWFSSLGSDASAAAGNIIDGLVNGIKNGVGLVVDAIKGLGTSALNALKSVLHIGSPSKEMMKLGQFAGHGFAQGVTAVNDNAHAAGEGLGTALGAGTALGTKRAGKGAAGKGAGGGVTVHLHSGAIQVTGAAGGSAAELTEQAVALLFERIAMEQGLGLAAAA